MNANHPPRSRRRGVLLLVVLSLLTLFLLLGTAYLVASSRARVTARAFNRLVMRSEEARVPATRHLDKVLRYALRGTSSTVSLAAPAPGLNVKFESLLEDKYGRPVPLAGTAQTVSLPAGTPPGAKSPLLVLGNVTVPGSPTLNAAELAGRVLTLLPPDGRPTSHRIIHAARTPSNILTIHVDWPTTAAAFRVPTGSCPILINGREFDGQGVTNEAWDAFDTANAFLAHVEPDPSAVSRANVLRFSYLDNPAPPGSPLMADNDNDGAKDGVFLDFGLPGVQTSAGTIDLHASVLIVDLDSRFNVNAHGSYASRIYPSTPPDWPSIPGTGSSLADVPLGSGYGPPEVNADWMFPSQTSGGYPANRAGARDASWLLSGSMAGSRILQTEAPPAQSVLRPTGSRFTVGSQTPLLQSTQGRYGESVGAPSASFRLKNANPSTPASAGDALPGSAAIDDVLSQINDQRRPPQYDNQRKQWAVNTAASDGVPVEWWDAATNYDYRNTRTSYNSPPDLHGRMKTLARPAAGSGIAPRLFYAKAEWGNETQDDPYELQLGSTAARNGWLADPSTSGFLPVFDNIFTFAELEPVLRPYDTDAFRLPLRLTATLGPLAEEARLRVTTDSWDTTAITGKAAANIAQWINACAGNFSPATSPIDGSLAGEVARGECFDLNRLLTNDKPPEYAPLHPYYLQRQAYFKDLYTLICAVLHPATKPNPDQATEYAQWAANVVEFRDADSTMTPFEYDADVLDGWTVDGDATTPDGPAVIWGAERPEMLIMQTSAWEDDQTGELFIVLHRPWNAAALSNSASIPAEPVDTALDVRNTLPQNVVDLGRKAGDLAANQTSAYPIWRLRVEDPNPNGGSALIRLDAADATATEFNSSLVTNQATTPKMGVDSWLCIRGTNTISATIPASVTDVQIDRGGAFRVPGQLPTAAGAPRKAMVYLERLTDPAAQNGVAQAWGAPPGNSSPPHYHVVDQAPIEVVNRIIPLPPAPQQAPDPSSISRDIATQGSALWKCVAANALGVPAPTIQLGPPAFPSGTSAAKWLPWPNRPFVSAAELFLVPGANAIDISPSANAAAMLRGYEAPEPNTNWFRRLHANANQSHLLLLDALRVPTRFAGIHRTITTDPAGSLANAGIFHETMAVNQLSAYREPGRVNLNTVTSDDVWNAVVAGSLAKPTSVSKANPEPDPLKTRQVANFAASPAKSMGDVLALGGSGGPVAPDTSAALSADNPAHRLYTANRLANTATIRSNVFAVWITLRESIAGNPDSIKYHRAFYIVDRSIPVAFEPGKDHNTWDTVVVRRIIE